MKKFTKLLGIVLIIALVMSMGTMAAFGEDAHSNVTVNVTVNGQTGHGYGYVQIFQGTQVVDGNEHNPLVDIQWGDEIDAARRTGIINAVNEVLELTGTDALGSGSTAIEVAEKIATMSTEQATELARLIYKVVRPGYGHGLHEGVNAVDPGYYLIYDQMDDGGPINFSDASNAALLQMTKDITITNPLTFRTLMEPEPMGSDIMILPTITLETLYHLNC